ncbi:MAG: hypothetical protein M1834_002817 [Cirrosporium novae-zelandiae]|nr:MAG: hypothetical protein M1834_002817 [Cirrosporium novae-zelandiae]
MVSDAIYDMCLPVLEDKDVEDEDKTEKLEELLRKETSLSGPPLEDAVLSILWRFRDGSAPVAASPSIRPTIIRRASPAPWQIPRASSPLTSPPISGVSLNPPPGFGIAPSAFTRARTASASPFSSPRPSPRLAFAAPIPHSPSLNAYEFSEPSPEPDEYGDIESDTVDWIVNDDTASNVSSTGGVSAASWMQSQQSDMSPYDMLRSVLGDGRTDEEIEKALDENGYDLSATINALMASQSNDGSQSQSYSEDGTVLVGKSMFMDQARPATPLAHGRSPVLCKYWVSTGQCLRADCRFSHDLGNHICKYWLIGNCLAGDTCIFSHDPSALVSSLSMNDSGVSMSATPAEQAQSQHNLQLQDYASFPALQPTISNQYSNIYQSGLGSRSSSYGSSGFSPLSPAFQARSLNRAAGNGPQTSRNHSRPNSRHQSRPSTPALAVDDTDAFPSLGSIAAVKSKKHHGKRGGHGHNHSKETMVAKEIAANTLADVVRMSPSPAAASPLRKTVKGGGKGVAMSRESSAAAQAIPPPQHVPWLQTGDHANHQYLKARQEAIKHGSLRNKFLQSAAQAWNRNDARAAKALSLRGQSENELMRKAHREAARVLYEERNKNSSANGEIYVDLHGLHPDEAITYLGSTLSNHHKSVSISPPSMPSILYVITGTGHHSKNGKDKVGKAIRSFLLSNSYIFREFSVPGDRGNVGGILGVDCTSGRLRAGKDRGEGEGERRSGGGLEMGKVKVIRREDVDGGGKGSG